MIPAMTANSEPPAMMPIMEVFVYLQTLDFFTTVIGLQIGASELSPFVGLLMHIGPVAGVTISKLLAAGLGAMCIWRRKIHLIRWINYWFAGLVMWNLFVILAYLRR